MALCSDPFFPGVTGRAPDAHGNRKLSSSVAPTPPAVKRVRPPTVLHQRNGAIFLVGGPARALAGSDLVPTAQPCVTGEGDGLGAVGGAELKENCGDVVLHRLDADAHPG